MKVNSLIKATLTATLALTLAFGATEAPTTQAQTYSVTNNPNAKEQVVFYIPHQDDEALTFSLGILNHIEAGYNVHVVLLTDGAGSVIRKRMGMSTEAFYEARNNEFLTSLRLMGVKEENIEFLGYPDGSLTADQVQEVVEEYAAIYPNARHKTYSYTDGHPDHANAGKGLQNAVKAGVTDDARYYVRRGSPAPKGGRLIREGYKSHYAPILQAVTDAYKLENPRLGLYGIGYKSVSKSFQWLTSTPSNYYHK